MSESKTWTEESLARILETFNSPGASFGPWRLSTYPMGSEDERSKFAACLELERRGLIYRLHDWPGHVLWGRVQV